MATAKHNVETSYKHTVPSLENLLSSCNSQNGPVTFTGFECYAKSVIDDAQSAIHSAHSSGDLKLAYNLLVQLEHLQARLQSFMSAASTLGFSQARDLVLNSIGDGNVNVDTEQHQVSRVA